LTLLRPATGEVQAMGVSSAPNAVMHSWLKHELLQVLADLVPGNSVVTEVLGRMLHLDDWWRLNGTQGPTG
jgi:hypothetical protein